MGSVDCAQGTKVTQSGSRVGNGLKGQDRLLMGDYNVRVGMMAQISTVTQGCARSSLTYISFKFYSKFSREPLFFPFNS